MPKSTLKHQTADGVVHTRQTARTYTHVILWHKPDGTIAVSNWVGRPDLVAGALRAAQKLDASYPGSHSSAEPINGGTRAEMYGDRMDANQVGS